MNFKSFLTESIISELPDTMHWIISFFEKRLDQHVLKIWGDALEERGEDEAAQLFHNLKWQNLKLKKSANFPKLYKLFNAAFGWNWRNATNWSKDGEMQNSWFFTEHPMGSRRHIVAPKATSYRLSLTTGQWSRHVNNTGEHAGIVSMQHGPETANIYPYTNRNISLRDYHPINVHDVPKELLILAFCHIINHLVKG